VPRNDSRDTDGLEHAHRRNQGGARGFLAPPSSNSVVFIQIYVIHSGYSEIPINFVFTDFSTPNIWAPVAPMNTLGLLVLVDASLITAWCVLSAALPNVTGVEL
jgi:hypothetical protein